ncbi:Bidirectional sugar transporter NEC1 [Linum perenne]
MPFSLSLFLTLCATAWFFYGLLVNDYYIAVTIHIRFVLIHIRWTLRYLFT